MTISLLIMSIQVHGQNPFVTDTTAKQLGVRTAIKKTYLHDSLTLRTLCTEFYDNNGKLTKRTSSFDKCHTISESFLYNSKGQLIEKRNINYYQSNSTIDTQKYSYNSKGQLESNFIGKIKYRFDDKGRVKERVEKTNVPVDLYIIYSYDSLGQIISVEEYLYNSMKQKRIYSYNEKGQIVKEEMYLYKNLLQKRIFNYNEKGQFIKETCTDYYNIKGVPNSEYVRTFFYNEKGLITTEYQTQTITSQGNKSDNRIHTYEYTLY